MRCRRSPPCPEACGSQTRTDEKALCVFAQGGTECFYLPEILMPASQRPYAGGIFRARGPAAAVFRRQKNTGPAAQSGSDAAINAGSGAEWRCLLPPARGAGSSEGQQDAHGRGGRDIHDRVLFEFLDCKEHQGKIEDFLEVKKGQQLPRLLIEVPVED